MRPLLELDWSRVWQVRDDGRLFVALLTAVGWLAWGMFALGTVVEAAALLTGRSWRLPGLGWSQGLAGALLLAVLTHGGAAAAQAAPPDSAVAVATATAVDAGGPDAGGPDAGGPGAAGPDAAGPDAAGPDAGPGAAGPDAGPGAGSRLLPAGSQPVAAPARLAPSNGAAAATHVVERGDDLWSLAVHYLGDGLQWRQLWELNRDRVPNPDHLEPGWILTLPRQAGALPAAAALPEVEPAGPDGPSRALPSAAPQGSSEEPSAVPAAQAQAEEPAGVAPVPPVPVPGAPQPEVPPALQPDEATTAELGDQEPAVQAGATGPAGPVAPAATISVAPAATITVGPAATITVAAGEAHAEEPPARADDIAEADERRTAAAVLGLAGLGALTAAGLLAGVSARRRGREVSRPLGRRFAEPPAGAQRLEAVLRSARREVDETDLALVQRVAGEHCRARELPHLARALVGPDLIELTFTDTAPPPPVGMQADGRCWSASAAGLEFLRAGDDSPLAWPALVAVGESDRGTVLVDLAEAGLLIVDDPAILRGIRAALDATASVEVVGATPPGVDEPGVDRAHQLDPDLAEAARPRVVVTETPLPDLLPAVAAGTRALVAPGEGRWRLDAWGLHSPWGDVALTPFSLSPQADGDLASLIAAATTEETEPAAWWADDDAASVTWIRPRPVSHLLVTRPPETTVPEPPHPTLQLLGPLELRGARGETPPRAIRQCMEYAAWLLEHPGATATQMATALIVAEGTRRSNMSRLRLWLGHDDEGRPYLPEAYSGRIMLSPDVGSDWQRFQILVGPGVNRVSPDSLAAALDLVRGAPLADAAPGQWAWAEPLRSDMVAAVRDAAVVLAQSALEAGDVALVRWATARGLAAAPGDELLLVLRIRAEHRAGNGAEVDRLIARLAQQARMLGVDLDEETVSALQEVLEGQARARRVEGQGK